VAGETDLFKKRSIPEHFSDGVGPQKGTISSALYFYSIRLGESHCVVLKLMLNSAETIISFSRMVRQVVVKVKYK